MYLPRSIHLSPSFLALYIYVPLLFCCTFLCHITCYPPLIFYVSSSVPHLRLPLFHLSLFLTSVAPTLVILYIPYDPFLIVQINLILTIPDQTRAVTYRDRTAPLGLTLRSLNSLRSCELAKYKIQYL